MTIPGFTLTSAAAAAAKGAGTAPGAPTAPGGKRPVTAVGTSGDDAGSSDNPGADRADADATPNFAALLQALAAIQVPPLPTPPQPQPGVSTAPGVSAQGARTAGALGAIGALGGIAATTAITGTAATAATATISTTAAPAGAPAAGATATVMALPGAWQPTGVAKGPVTSQAAQAAVSTGGAPVTTPDTPGAATITPQQAAAALADAPATIGNPVAAQAVSGATSAPNSVVNPVATDVASATGRNSAGIPEVSRAAADNQFVDNGTTAAALPANTANTAPSGLGAASAAPGAGAATSPSATALPTQPTQTVTAQPTIPAPALPADTATTATSAASAAVTGQTDGTAVAQALGQTAAQTGPAKAESAKGTQDATATADAAAVSGTARTGVAHGKGTAEKGDRDQDSQQSGPATTTLAPVTAQSTDAVTNPGAQSPVVADGNQTTTAAPALSTVDLTVRPQAVDAPGQAPAPQQSAPTQNAHRLATELTPLRGHNGDHTITVHLHPVDLGPVVVTARISGGDIRLDLGSATAAGREAIRAALPELRAELESAGYSSCVLSDGASAHADQQSQQSQRAQWDRWTADAVRADAPAMPDIPVAIPTRSPAAGVLDLHA
ncbi:flagellar hook-length control protein FliK [Actinokineospora enzanensis]|uniref:flagellar hook-length control protein FliK n=1 Tax=Actinokineospora enzanensis TaxID=155975 RepID=UPI000375B7BC|nr:flagellar hook-length control protein FliK [Actinokineospora enzanensis]